MRPLRKFEKRLEKLFEEPFAKAFRSGVHPLEIARRLVRELEDAKMLGVSGVLAPNRFVVHLGPRDYERLSGVVGNLATEMETLVITQANQKDYHLTTRPRVEFELDGSMQEGEFSIVASLDEPTTTQPPTERVEAGRQRAQAESRLGILTVLKGEKAGISFDLDMARTGVGRAEENVLVLSDPLASRFHAEIERTPSGYIIRDLGSTNGTMVQGRRISERLLEDGDTLVVGGTEMRFGLITGPRKR